VCVLVVKKWGDALEVSSVIVLLIVFSEFESSSEMKIKNPITVSCCDCKPIDNLVKQAPYIKELHGNYQSPPY